MWLGIKDANSPLFFILQAHPMTAYQFDQLSEE